MIYKYRLVESSYDINTQTTQYTWQYTSKLLIAESPVFIGTETDLLTMLQKNQPILPTNETNL